MTDACASSGYKPITTCSPKNFALVKRFGAAHAIDYNAPDCAAQIRAVAGGRLDRVLDIITDGPSQEICHASFGRRGGRYTCLEKPADELHGRKNTVKMDMVVGLAASGKEIALDDGYERSADPALRANAAAFFRSVQKKLDEGVFEAHPARVLPGGFQGLLEGLDILRQKQTSGEKLVAFIGAE